MADKKIYKIKQARRQRDQAVTSTGMHSSGDRGGSEEPIAQHPVRTTKVYA